MSPSAALSIPSPLPLNIPSSAPRPVVLASSCETSHYPRCYPHYQRDLSPSSFVCAGQHVALYEHVDESSVAPEWCVTLGTGDSLCRRVSLFSSLSSPHSRPRSLYSLSFFSPWLQNTHNLTRSLSFSCPCAISRHQDRGQHGRVYIGHVVPQSSFDSWMIRFTNNLPKC